MSSGSGGADKHHGLGHSPGGAGLGGIVMGGGSGGAEGLLTAVGAVALPGRAAVRRTLWALLQGLLLAANLRYLGLLTRLQQDAYFLYYQPFMPMLAMLWLWALAVRIFERRRIRYEACFSPEDQRHLLRSTQLFQVGSRAVQAGPRMHARTASCTAHACPPRRHRAAHSGSKAAC